MRQNLITSAANARQNRLLVKYCLIVVFIFCTDLSSGQVEISIGISEYAGMNSNIGINAGISIKKIHLDFSSNFRGGSRELDNNYNPGTKTENHLIVIFNAGYCFRITDKLYLLPEIGIGSKNDIYIRYNNRYSYENPGYFINFGFASRFFISEEIGFLLGVGYPEQGKIALIYKLW